MPNKYPRSDQLQSAGDIESMYLVFDDNSEGRFAAQAALTNSIESYSGTVHASRSQRTGFDPGTMNGDGITGRYGLTTDGYEAWRPGERSRYNNPKHTMLAADICYARHGLIKNIIDLMSDFGSQGIRLVHPNKRIEKFYQNWWRKVQGGERSERWLNSFYRLGQTAIRWQTATISPSVEDRLYKTSAGDMQPEVMKVNKKEIPWKYTFLHPATLDIVGGPLANFIGSPRYAIKLPQYLLKVIKAPRNKLEEELVAQLPAEVKAAAETNRAVPLPQDRTRVYHYKKDDWQEWADPMIASILIDISLYEKLKLADRAALDGAISNIRIFKLGSLEHKIIPGEAAAQKLASILEANTQAGTLDLIWGPDIELIESKTSVHQFLGKEKYEPTLIAIYAGLGIPPTLTGTFGAAGTTNNFISLKTLTQRLEYGRDALVQFWNEQIRIVQEAMGFRFPAKVEFDMMTLGDEAAEKALLIQLADRSLVSDEVLQRHFQHDPEMERIRIKREAKDREAGRMVPKAGQFHDPMFEENLMKVFVQTGVITPSEAGVELKSKKKGEQPALKMRQPTGAGGIAKKPGSSKTKTNKTPGRKTGTNDTTTRKKATFRPKTKASTLAIWARAAQEVISDILNPFLLNTFSKKNMRSLSSEQMSEAEKIRFGVLCNLEPMSTINEETIYKALETKASSTALLTYREWENQVSDSMKRSLTMEERKNIQAHVYAALAGEE